MARPRTPTAVLKLRGAFKNHREFEPFVATDLPEPLKHLIGITRAAWLEMKARGYWLTSAD
jgi:hypothetical protein